MHIFLVRIEGCSFDSAHSVHFGRYTGRQLQRIPVVKGCHYLTNSFGSTLHVLANGASVAYY